MEAELAPGTRLRSAVSEVEIIVVQPPGDAVTLHCGGEPMVGLDETPPAAAIAPGAEPTLLGKRYVDEATNLEVLCTKGGDGALAADDRPLMVKDAKPLPSSD